MTAGHPWHTLAVELSEPVAYVRFNRPERHNAVTAEMADEMTRPPDLASRDGISVVVLTGTGTTFCPGADINAGDRTGRRSGQRRSRISPPASSRRCHN